MKGITKVKSGLLMALLCCSPLLWALASDDQKPLLITSDSGELNNKTGVWTYLGHVVADQGSRHLISDKLTVFRGPNGDLSKVLAQGNPSHISFQNKPEDPLTNGYGKSITYDATQKSLVLENDAKFENGGDTYSAPVINYQMVQDVVTSPKSEKGRTTIVIQPRNGRSPS